MEDLPPQPADIEEQLRRDDEAEAPALREIGETHLEILISQFEGLLEVNWGLLETIGELRKDVRRLTEAVAASGTEAGTAEPEPDVPKERDGQLDFGEE